MTENYDLSLGFAVFYIQTFTYIYWKNRSLQERCMSLIEYSSHIRKKTASQIEAVTVQLVLLY